MESVVMATFCTLVIYLFLQFVNFQAAIGPDSPMSLGWFKSSVGNLSNKYPTPVTPAGYTFSIWGLIYLWNFAWIIYVLTTLCRTNSRGPVFLNPPATTVMFLNSFMLNNVANMLWLVLWDREYLTRSTLALCLIVLTLYVGLYISLTSVYQYLADFKDYAESDLWAYRVLVHNGLAIYAAWTTAASLVNLSVTLIYVARLPSDVATYVCLTTLAVILIVYFVFELFVFDVYTRYVFMVYPTFIWALAGIMVANGDDTNSPVFVYSAILVSISFIFFIVKTVLMIIRDPVYLFVKMTKVDSTTYKHMI
ncbi:uncharacterized protein LOC588719 [Strongylocentrotus purpuratus]|uniref:Uncharacterized protein n=1 Tax=Strongylocentrotus purpuratus TaxID=7668 RepID=A0A7M7NRX7_STRPU|nr:uncharacterized protein LOC588719 [Strongylocentrotus purpuratus]